MLLSDDVYGGTYRLLARVFAEWSLTFDTVDMTDVDAVRAHHPHVVAMSALLTTTMLSMPDTIQAIDAAGLRAGVKIIIGGAATTEAFAKDIRADGYGADAASAVTLAKALIGVGGG